MGNWKGWRYFNRLSIYPIKSILRKVTSNFRFKSEGKTTLRLRLRFQYSIIHQWFWITRSELTCICFVFANLFIYGVEYTGHRNGLLSLYKDMESCGEYADIQVMWKMIESSSPQYACCHKKRINRSSYWVVCFRPTWTVFWVVSFSWWDEFTCFKYDRWVYKRREIKIFLMSVPFLQPLYLPSHHYQRKSKWMIKVYIWISCRSQYLLSLVYILGLGLDFVF